MRVLLIWEENPEGCKFYVIENPTKRQLQVLEVCNEKFVNSDDLEELHLLNAALAFETVKYFVKHGNEDCCGEVEYME